MCADAWFDLCTSPAGSPFVCTVAEAAAELMVAAVCLAVGLRGGGQPRRYRGSSTLTTAMARPSPAATRKTRS